MNPHKHDQGYSDAVVANPGRFQTLGFDDVDVSAGHGLAQMPPGYGGLTWSNGWDVVKPSEGAAAYPKSGYFVGTTSGDQVAFNANDGSVEISAASFNLKTARLTAAWDSQLVLHIDAYRGDKLVLHTSITISDAVAASFDFNQRPRPTIEQRAALFAIDRTKRCRTRRHRPGALDDQDRQQVQVDAAAAAAEPLDGVGDRERPPRS